MKAKIIPIGNSKGVRIPKVLLEESGLGKEVELHLDGKGIVISPAKAAAKIVNFNEEYLLSHNALAKDWSRPEEDEAWQYLQ